MDGSRSLLPGQNRINFRSCGSDPHRCNMHRAFAHFVRSGRNCFPYNSSLSFPFSFSLLSLTSAFCTKKRAVTNSWLLFLSKKNRTCPVHLRATILKMAPLHPVSPVLSLRPAWLNNRTTAKNYIYILPYTQEFSTTFLGLLFRIFCNFCMKASFSCNRCNAPV